jgi:hypothetical protein
VIKTTVKKQDNGKPLGELLKSIAKMQVYVGIPEEKTGRKKGPVNNAQLLYIHTNGSQLKGIPKRPVIEPALEAKENKEAITSELGEAVKSLLDKKPAQAKMHLKRAGMIGQNAARDWFEDSRNGWVPNSLETARRKAMKIKGKGKKQFNQLISEGASVQHVEISRPLIDTAQMRKAIIYVVKDNG